MRFLPETPDLRGDAHRIINRALRDALPDRSVKQALSRLSLPECVTLVAVGKAAWVMAKAATDFLGGRVTRGVVINTTIPRDRCRVWSSSRQATRSRMIVPTGPRGRPSTL